MPVGNVDVPNPGNFHNLPHKSLPPCFVQGSLIGGSCIILVPFGQGNHVNLVQENDMVPFYPFGHET